jgi:ABC-type multidrug transport system ATPase subunit
MTFRMEPIIKVTGLHKRFGRVQALDGMSFTVRPGQVTGFLGPNGAGKSTTMRVILGLDAPDAGTATIGGHSYRALKNPLSRVSSLLDAAAPQPGRSARNRLLWLAHSQGLKSGRVDEVIALTISHLSSERTVAILAGHAVPFADVTAHRATVEYPAASGGRFPGRAQRGEVAS